jgi:uncharacterized repeat protein (TIGR01451 family)
MTKLIKLLAASSGVAAAMLGANPAFAAGTASGSTISNTATVSYSVGGIAQTPVAPLTPDTFTVDRKVVLTVTQLGTTTTQVAPGVAQAATTFTITNGSNATIDIGLAAANLAGGAAPNGGTDGFDVTAPFTYYIDNGDGIFNAGDTLVTYLDEIAADASRVVHVVAAVPLTATNGQIAAVSLTGQARESGVTGTQGAVIANTAGANTAGVDTVLADAAGSDDGAADGRHSARDDYTVSAATLAVVKTSRVVWDPINLAVNPKAIPGARVEYCIAVSNSGGTSATAVGVSDTLVATLAPYGTFGYWTGATVASGVCTGGTNNGAAAGQVVSGTIGTVAAGTTSGFYFQATVQ